MAYKVKGAVVTAEQDTPDGRQVRYFYQDAVIQKLDDATAEHLLSIGLIVELEEGPSLEESAAAGDAAREAEAKADAAAAKTAAKGK